MKWRKKPVEVEVTTFDEFEDYGRTHAMTVIDGIPQAFEFAGHPITAEGDRGYLIPTKEGLIPFTREDVLITGVAGEIYPCKIDIFKKTSDPAE